ncbi:phage tail tape measure protein, partial [Rhodococcus jostii]
MPAGVELATAYVTLAAETSDLARDVARVGTRAGNGFASNFTTGTRSIGTEVQRQVRRVDASGAGRRSGSDFTVAFTGQVDGVGNSVDDALGSAGRGAGGAGSGMGASFLGGFSDTISGLAGKGGPIAAALAGVAVVGLAAGKVLADAVSDGMAQMQQRDLIQARLGVNEETMAVIGTAAGAAFSNAWGESAQANMEAAQLAIQSGILGGEETAGQMQPVIEGLNVVTDLMGGEMTDTVRAVSALMKNGLVGSSTEAFDVITRGFQRGGDLGDDLIDTLSEYSNGWKQTGFSAEFALGLVNQAVANGADNTDRAGDAIREFGRRMTEEGDTIKATIGGLGLPVDELFDKLKAGGPAGEAAFDQIFDSIRQIEDPLDRAAAAQSLLGDTAGDFINAFTQWDPSTAVTAFGDVTNAAKTAGDTMSSNPGAQWQASMNQISVAADQVKLSLAGAFAPMITDLAAWVSTHKPEIIGFFTGLGDATLGTLDAVLGFTSGGLKAWAFFADGVGGTIGGIVQKLAGLVNAQADVLDLIPGMGGQADDFRDIAAGMNSFADTVGTAGDKARGMAEIIDTTLRPGLQGARTDLQTAGAQAQDTALLMRALGSEVQLIPSEKGIEVSSNSPEVQASLAALGVKVETLPDGTFVVTSNTADGQRILDNFVAANSGREIPLTIRYNEIRTQRMQQNPGFVGPIGGFSTGGTVRGPGTGTSDSILAYLSDEEFVVKAAASKKNRPLLEAINNGWVPPAGMLHDMLPGFAGGGVVSADELAQFAQGVEGAEYEWGGVNWGDCSGAVSAVANFATGADPFGSRFATGNEGASLAAMGFQPGLGPAGSLNIGWFNGGEYGGHTALTLPNGVNVEMGG